MTLPSDKKKAAIQAFIDAGYCLIPLNGKIPLEKRWPEIPPGRYNETNLPGNYGVSLRAGDLALDIDPRNFAKGDSPIKRLVEDIKAPLYTFIVKTGRGDGGMHLYFRKPPDLLVRGKIKGYPGIDIRSLGQQLVGPGSIHPETKGLYKIAAGSPQEVADAPPGLLALAERSAEPWSEVTGTGRYINDAETQGRFASYLKDDAPTSGAFAVACRGRDLGLPPDSTWTLMVDIWNDRREIARTAEELRVKVVHAYTYASGPVGSAHPDADFKPVAVTASAPSPEEEEIKISWNLTPAGKIIKGFYNLLNYLRLPTGGLRGIFGYNEFTGQIEFLSPAPWHRGKMPGAIAVNDNDLKLLKGYLAVKHNYEMHVQALEEAVTNVAFVHRFHPVRKYLNNLKWDGKPRVNTWLTDHAGVEDTPYTQACARKILCAAVMRVFCPGCEFHHVLVLEGAQDIGKSSICKILGGEWAADFSVDPSNKDTVQAMQGKWIIELAELEWSRRTENEAIKAFLTRPSDRIRVAYGRLTSEFPRQSIFIASKNPGPDGTYLKDDTGNRRWWPVRCNPKRNGKGIRQVNFRDLKEIRDQLFAEAMHLVKTKGEHLFMETSELKKAAKDIAALRHAEHEWTEPISLWIDTLKPPRSFLTSREIFIDCLHGVDTQLNRRVTMGIASVMRTLEWEPGLKRRGVHIVRGYVRNGAKTEEPERDLSPLKDIL